MLSLPAKGREQEDGPSAYLRALVIEFAILMERRAYKRYMQPLLSVRQKTHLWALRNQALFGDVPDDTDQAEQDKESKMSTGADAHNGKEGPVTAPTGAGCGGLRPPSRPRHWYHFTERLQYDAWIALRGVMSLHVAAETFCTEFFYLLKAFPVPAMLPLVESALHSARAKTIELVAAVKKSGSHTPRNRSEPREEEGFCIRGCPEDPAVIAFMWLCRAHCIPCEALFEPLASAPGEQDVFVVRARQGGTVLTDPLAAFSLCVEMYLPDGEHWMGILPPNMSHSGAYKSKSNPHSNTSTGLTYHAQRAMERSMWIEYMRHIETDLRAPLLRYVREVQSQERGRECDVGRQRSAKGYQAARNKELANRLNELSREAVASLSRYERFVTHYYRTRPASARILVSVAELCVAAYSFVLCTNPHCEVLLPFLENTAPSSWAANGSHYTSNTSLHRHSDDATAGTAGTKGTERTEGTGSPAAALLLRGVPPASQAIARRILDEQSSAARSSSIASALGAACRGLQRLRPLSLPLRREEHAAAAPGASEAAMDAVAALIRAKCTPVKQCLAELLARVWIEANEQCIGFPFLVLDEEQAPFLTSPANAAETNTGARAPWSGGHFMSFAKPYWEIFRAVFGLSTSASYELRTYRNPTARL